jgi:hypothetical protein
MEQICENHINLVPEALNNYLANTRLSMDQVAKKWKISGAMLSQIKNGKKRAGIDLGLKILRENGSDIDARRNWLEAKFLESSEEVTLIQSELEKGKVEQALKSDFCRSLENDPLLLDIFLDIALSEDIGISWNAIFKNYGEHGIELAQSLMQTSIVSHKDGRYYISSQNMTHVTNEETSFGIVKALLEKQKTFKKRGLFHGELQYDITDISREGYDELIELNKEYVKKVRKIVEANEQHRLKGGIRVFAQSIISIAKGKLS